MESTTMTGKAERLPPIKVTSGDTHTTKSTSAYQTAGVNYKTQECRDLLLNIFNAEITQHIPGKGEQG